VRSKGFYARDKIRLADLRSVRAEMCRCYCASVRKELDWQDLRAAIACLSAIASLDQGIGADERLRQIEEQVGLSIRPNGHHPEARP